MKALPTSTPIQSHTIEYVTVTDVTLKSLPYHQTDKKENDYSFIYICTAFVLTCVVSYFYISDKMSQDYHWIDNNVERLQ